MSIITFWSDGREKVGKTLSMVAIATNMAIEHNYKILVISTEYASETLNRCFWKEKKEKGILGMLGSSADKMIFEDSVDGLVRVIRSNRASGEMITDYSQIIFKDRLEILKSFKGNYQEYAEIARTYPEIIKMANGIYDLVFVDLSPQIDKDTSNKILNESDIVVANISQKLSKVEEFRDNRNKISVLNDRKTILAVGNYDLHSKYNYQNITRFLGEKNKIVTVPYNTLYFEAAEEGAVPDLFLQLRRLTESDDNKTFVDEIRRASESIMYRIQDLQMRM